MKIDIGGRSRAHKDLLGAFELTGSDSYDTRTPNWAAVQAPVSRTSGCRMLGVQEDTAVLYSARGRDGRSGKRSEQGGLVPLKSPLAVTIAVDHGGRSKGGGPTAPEVPRCRMMWFLRVFDVSGELVFCL